MGLAVLNHIAYQSIWILLKISAPILIIAIVVGLVVSIIQTTTSIQEQTLTFVPKFIAIMLALVIFGNWILKILTEFTIRLLNSIPNVL